MQIVDQGQQMTLRELSAYAGQVVEVTEYQGLDKWVPLRLGTRLTTGGHNELLYGLRAKYVVSPKDVHKMGILGIKNQAPLDLDQSVTLNGGQPVFIRPADQTKYRDTVFSYDGNRLMT